jgi:hypothetical protein
MQLLSSSGECKQDLRTRYFPKSRTPTQEILCFAELFRRGDTDYQRSNSIDLDPEDAAKCVNHRVDLGPQGSQSIGFTIWSRSLSYS